MDSDRALMQQALEALEAALSDGKPYIVQSKDAIAALRARLAQPESDPDPSRCPKCGGEADNGHDRCVPPNPYHCTKCMEQPEPVAEVDEVAQRFDGNWSAIVCTGSVELRAGDKLYAAPPQAVGVPDGWQLVPMGPSPDMARAGWALLPSGPEDAWDAGLGKAKAVYRAMLSSAPKAPAPAPPPRQWVDLTKDEVIAIRKSPRPVDLTAWSDTLAFARAISEALKAKNGGTEC